MKVFKSATNTTVKVFTATSKTIDAIDDVAHILKANTQTAKIGALIDGHAEVTDLCKENGITQESVPHYLRDALQDYWPTGQAKVNTLNAKEQEQLQKLQAKANS